MFAALAIIATLSGAPHIESIPIVAVFDVHTDVRGKHALTKRLTAFLRVKLTETGKVKVETAQRCAADNRR